jgi:arabinogalactan oligomer/maltooligosaccharide transport system permease protein
MNRKPNAAAQIVSYTALVLMVLFALYPVWFIFLAAVRPGQRLLTLDVAGMFMPTEFTAENFEKMLFELDFPNWLKNSLFVAGMTTISALSLATSAAFAFSRFRFRGRELGLILFLAIQAFPGVLALVPIAQTLSAIGLYQNHWGLILAYSAGSLVFTTWNLKGYFDTIPIELEEAAMIDGCGPVQSFIRIALPLAKPALAVTALFGFLAGWGDYVLANVVIPAPDSMRTLPVGLYSLANDHSVPWGQFAAGALLISVPVLILFLGLQRFLESGLTLGGVKG